MYLVRTKRIKKTVKYVVHYKYPWCFDDGGPFHDQLWGDNQAVVEAKTDKQAQAASLDDQFWSKANCYCRGGETSYTTKIVKHVHEETDDGFIRDTQVDIPRPTSKRCACGKQYWPVLGEKRCHKLVVEANG